MLFKKCSSFSFANGFSLFMNSDPLCIQKSNVQLFFLFYFSKDYFYNEILFF